MAYSIEFSQDAERHLAELTARQRSTLLDSIEAQLTWEPDKPSKARKLLRPNPMSAWELRIGDFRGFYNIMPSMTVVIVAIGRKHGSLLMVDGRVYVL